MSTNVVLEPFNETLQPGEYKPIYSYGQMLTILSNSAAADIWVGIGELRPVPLEAGLQYELPQGNTYNKLLLYNPEAVPTTVKLILSIGDVRDNRMSVAGQINTSDLLVLQQLQGNMLPLGHGAEKIIGVAQSQILAANVNRIGFSVQAKSTNGGIIYVGFADSVTTGNWVAELQAGMSYTLDNYRGPIHAISDTANQKLGWGEW